MKTAYMWFILFLLVLPIALAADYTPTGAKNFTLYTDAVPELATYVYSTVIINESLYPGEVFRCVTNIFAQQNTTYLHVQANPEAVKKQAIVVGGTTPCPQCPEELGYFPVNNGLANVYYRSKDIIAYNGFLYVVICRSNQTQLVYEQNITPVYKEFGKELPSRGVWFANGKNADTIVIVVVGILFVILFIYFKFSK